MNGDRKRPVYLEQDNGKSIQGTEPGIRIQGQSETKVLKIAFSMAQVWGHTAW